MKRALTMVSLVQQYLALRRQLGFALGIAGEQLLTFGRFADESGHSGPVTLELAVRWAQASQRATPLTWARRLEVLRPFAKYRSQLTLALSSCRGDSSAPHIGGLCLISTRKKRS